MCTLLLIYLLFCLLIHLRIMCTLLFIYLLFYLLIHLHTYVYPLIYLFTLLFTYSFAYLCVLSYLFIYSFIYLTICILILVTGILFFTASIILIIAYCKSKKMKISETDEESGNENSSRKSGMTSNNIRYVMRMFILIIINKWTDFVQYWLLYIEQFLQYMKYHENIEYKHGKNSFINLSENFFLTFYKYFSATWTFYLHE